MDANVTLVDQPSAETELKFGKAELESADGSPSLKASDCRLHAAPAHC